MLWGTTSGMSHRRATSRMIWRTIRSTTEGLWFCLQLRKAGQTNKPRPVVRGTFPAFDGIEKTDDEACVEEMTKKRKRSSTPLNPEQEATNGDALRVVESATGSRLSLYILGKAMSDSVFDEELRQEVAAEVELLKRRKKKGERRELNID